MTAEFNLADLSDGKFHKTWWPSSNNNDDDDDDDSGGGGGSGDDTHNQRTQKCLYSYYMIWYSLTSVQRLLETSLV